MVESEEEKEEEGDADADTEIDESSHVTPDVDSGTKKRKNADQGADARKKKLLCQLAASNKRSGITDKDMKQFFEGLLKASFTAFEGKIAAKKKELITDDPLIDLPGVNLTLSPGIDVHMSKQDYLQRCFPDLSQDTFVEGFDPSQPKTDDPLALSSLGTSEKIDVRELNDYQTARPGENDPDAQFVYVDPENYERLQEWQDLRTGLQVGPCFLNEAICTRIISQFEWIHNI
ncbi:unnamed protein product, partial [Eruca vesicaria subsp. sativa]|nr:unnamed protein product [Eruca vesicaria subsp. sativa]